VAVSFAFGDRPIANRLPELALSQMLDHYPHVDHTALHGMKHDLDRLYDDA
jgi:hypothetical protein